MENLLVANPGPGLSTAQDHIHRATTMVGKMYDDQQALIANQWSGAAAHHYQQAADEMHDDLTQMLAKLQRYVDLGNENVTAAKNLDNQ